MNLLKTTLRIDLQDPVSTQVVRVVEGDTARTVAVGLYDGGAPYEPGSGCYAVLLGTKPDGAPLFNSCTISGNQIQYAFTQQTTSCVGVFNVHIRLYGAQKQVLTSVPIQLEVYASAMEAEQAAQSYNEQTALDDLMSRTQDLNLDVAQTLAAVTGLKVEAKGLPLGSPASVLKRVNPDGSITLIFGLPCGPKGPGGGPKGDPAILKSSKVEYQISSTGTQPPAGSWLSSPSQPKPGQYLWTRTTQIWDSGDPVVSYTLSYIPPLPADLIRTVNGQHADSSGALKLTYEQIGLIPAMHRAVVRGKNLGKTITAAQLAAIRDGSFRDLWLGDYWCPNPEAAQKQQIHYMILDMDYWYGVGDVPFRKHHLVVGPSVPLYQHRMNPDDSTAAGYAGSEMRTHGLSQAKTMFTQIFPNSILAHRAYLDNSVENGVPSSAAWFASELDLMNENMLYGHPQHGTMNMGQASAYTYTCDQSQLAYLSLCPSVLRMGKGFWLRDVVADWGFASFYPDGCSSTAVASNVNGVLPVAAIG